MGINEIVMYLIFMDGLLSTKLYTYLITDIF